MPVEGDAQCAGPALNTNDATMPQSTALLLTMTSCQCGNGTKLWGDSEPNQVAQNCRH